MATVKRLVYTRWAIPDPTDPKKKTYVKAGTPGAVKVKELGDTYFVIWKEGGKTRREATGLTDGRKAIKYLDQWNDARELGRVGGADYRRHMDKPITDHLAEYIAAVSEAS